MHSVLGRPWVVFVAGASTLAPIAEGAAAANADVDIIARRQVIRVVGRRVLGYLRLSYF